MSKINMETLELFIDRASETREDDDIQRCCQAIIHMTNNREVTAEEFRYLRDLYMGLPRAIYAHLFQSMTIMIMVEEGKL